MTTTMTTCPKCLTPVSHTCPHCGNDPHKKLVDECLKYAYRLPDSVAEALREVLNAAD